MTPIATVQLMKAVIQPGFDTGADRNAGTIPTTHHIPKIFPLFAHPIFFYGCSTLYNKFAVPPNAIWKRGGSMLRG